MESNHNETKKQKRKLLGILALLIGCLVLCSVVAIATLIGRQNSKVDQSDTQLSSAQTAGSAEELRELLLKSEKLTIKLQEDVAIEEPLLVNGTKTLTGKHTISMALYAKPYQDVLSVSEDASLTIDGVTIDGNGIANGINVEKTGNLELISGEIIYGFPFGVESGGKVTMRGGIIEHAMCSGISVVAGEAYLTAGEVIDSVESALHVANGGYASVSHEIRLCDSGVYSINNFGETEITGGEIKNAHKTLIKNQGALTVQGSAENKLELCNADYEGIWSTEESTMTKIDGIYLHDIGHTGLYMKSAKNVDIQNAVIEDTGMAGINITTKAKGTAKNIEIKSAGTVGLCVRDGGEFEVEDIVVTSPELRGLMCLGGKLTAKNIEITSPGEYGITCATTDKFEGTAILENVTIEGVKTRNGINVVSGALAQVTGGSITRIKKEHGAKIHGEGSKLILKDVDIEDCTQIGIVAMSKGAVELNNVNISDCGGKGISATVGATVTYNKGTMKGFKEVAVYLNRSNVALSNVTLDGLDSHGVYNNSGTVALNNVTVNKAGNAGLFLVNQGSKATIDTLVIKEPKERGIRCEGGVITGKNVEVIGATTYAITSNIKKETVGSITLENVKISDMKNGKYAINVLAGSHLEINGGTIDEGNTGIGARVYGENSKLVLKKVDVKNCGSSGVQASSKGEAVLDDVNISNCSKGVDATGGAKITANGGTITNTKGVGAYTNKGIVALTDVTLADTKSHGVYNNGGKVELNGVAINKAGNVGIFLVNKGSEANIVNTIIKEPVERGIRCEGGVITGKNVEIISPTTYAITSNIKDDTVSSVALENVKISGVKNGKYAINVLDGSYLAINGGTIDEGNTGIGARAYGENSKLVLKNVKLKNCGEDGVLTNGKAEAVLENVNISDCAKAVSANGGSTITAIGGTMTDMSGVAVYNSASTVNLTGVSVKEPGSHGIYNNKGIVNASDIEITKVPLKSVFTKGENGITILSKVNKENKISVSGENDIYACEGGTVQISDSILSGAGSHAVYSAGGTIKLNTVMIEKPGKTGVYNEAGTVKLNGVEIKETGKEGIYVMYEGSTAEINSTKISSTGERAIRCEGGIITGDTVEITSPKTYAITSNNKDAAVGSIILGNVTISNVVNGSRAINVDNGSYLEINGGTINEGKTGVGVRAVNTNSKLVLRDVNILNCGAQAVIASNKGEVVLEGVNISSCGSNGIHNSKGTVSLKNVSVQDVTNHGICCENKGTVNGDVVTISGAGKSSVYATGANTFVELQTLTASGNLSGANLYAGNGAVLKVNGGQINTTGTQGCCVEGASTVVQMSNVAFGVIDENAFYVNQGQIIVDNVTINRSNVNSATTFYDLELAENASYTLNEKTVTYSIPSLADWLNRPTVLEDVIPITLPGNVDYEVGQRIGLEGTETVVGTKYWGSFGSNIGVFQKALSFASGVYAGTSGATTAKDPATATGTLSGGEVTVTPADTISLDGVKGVMWYVDFSDLTKDEDGNGFCASVYMSCKIDNKNVVFRSTNSAGGYIYQNGAWEQRPVATGGTCRISVPDNYKGWVYVPLSSYVNRTSGSTAAICDGNGIGLAGVTLNSVNLYSRGYELDTTKNITWDEILFVKERYFPSTLPGNVAYEVGQRIGLEGTETVVGTKYWGSFGSNIGVFQKALSFASGVYAGTSGATTAKDPATATGTLSGGEVTVTPADTISLDGVKGVMWYVDFSDLTKDEDGNGFCASVYMSCKIDNKNVVFRSTNSAGGYIYQNGAWEPRPVATGGTCRISVPDNYKGWVYVPLSSYVNRTSGSTAAICDGNGIGLAGVTLNSVNLYSRGYELDTTKNITWDEILFVKTK